uniref:Chromatin accessibility complex subunit 1 n=1 Tax=Monodelphis domestica TaxID=13616 RepID=A0A5F8GMN2_MONDO
MADGFGGKEKCSDQRLVSLPLSRIRVIMKSSPEVSSINQEALVLTAKATHGGVELGARSLASFTTPNSLASLSDLQWCELPELQIYPYSNGR